MVQPVKMYVNFYETIQAYLGPKEKASPNYRFSLFLQCYPPTAVHLLFPLFWCLFP